MALRSWAFNIGFWLWIFILGMSALPFCLIYRPLSLRVARLWAHGTLWMLRQWCGITYRIKGREYIPSQPALIASKHQSAWDTVIFWVLLRDPSYVLKRELIYLPVFGWYLLLLQCIYINRKAGTSAMKRMLRQAKLMLQKNRSIVIYPEGTRTAPGAASVYHPGVAALYTQLQVPVVPVALNSGLLWPRNAWKKKPGVITIEFLPPIMPGLKGRDFLKQLEQTIEPTSNSLLAASTHTV